MMSATRMFGAVAAVAAAVSLWIGATCFTSLHRPAHHVDEDVRSHSKAVDMLGEWKEPQQSPRGWMHAGGVGLLGACVSLLVASVTTRSTLQSRRRTVALKAFDTELGATLPFKYWDPLGLASDGDAEAFRRRRAAEIKNGRVAMLACMGWIAPEYFRFPGYLSPSMGIKFADLPSGMQVLSKVPYMGWVQYGIFIGFLELFPMRQQEDRAPGDMEGFGWLGLPGWGGVEDPAKRERALNAEINNGRLAMVAIMGMVSQNGMVGTTGPEMWIPGSAFDSESGATLPLKYWDPLGLASDGDSEAFRRRRAAEIKNGRVAMLACMGWIAPEYFRFPGYLSPSMGIKFADLPSGMQVLSKVPYMGWVQYGIFIGFLELFPMRQQEDRAPGDMEGFGWLGLPGWGGVEDPAKRERALNAEINNGRLAMVAIMGMVSQNGMVGTTGPEMWIPGSAFDNELRFQ